MSKSTTEPTTILYISATSLDGVPSPKIKANPMTLIKKFMAALPLNSKDLQKATQMSVYANLLDHLDHYIHQGSDINHSSTGYDHLLHAAWHQADKKSFNLLLEKGAFLTKDAQDFYKDTDPSFVKACNNNNSDMPSPPNPATKRKY